MKYKGLTGYSLHLKRIDFSGGKATRAVKYPIDCKNKKHLKNLADHIFSDYQAIVGDFNINDWIKNKEKEKHPYSLFDFWRDSLRAGVVFFPNAAELIDRFNPDIKESIKRQVQKTNPDFSNLVKDWDKLMGYVVLPREFRSNKTKGKVEAEMKEIFKLEKEETIDGNAKEFCFTIKSLIGKGKEEKHNILLKKYGINRNLLSETDMETNLTFCPHPDIPANREADIKDLMNTIQNMFGEKYKDRMGLDSEYNSQSNYLGAQLKRLREGKTGEIKADILKAAPVWKGKEKELEKRLDKLSQCAKKLADRPELAEWRIYRLQMGKIKSYVSNIETQKGKIEEQIEKHIEDFKEIRKDIEAGEFPLSKEYMEHLQKLENLAVGLRGKMEDSPHEELNFYDDLMGRFRSELNRRYQESDTNNKKAKYETAAHAYKSIHSDLRKIPAFPGETAKEMYKKYADSWERLKAGTEFLAETLKTPESGGRKPAQEDEEFLLGRLNSLKRIYGKQKEKDATLRNGSMNTARFAGVVRNAVLKAAKIDLHDCGEKDYFIRGKGVNSQRRWSGKDLSANIKGKNPLPLIEGLVKNLQPDWNGIFKMKGGFKNAIHELLDAVEVEKARAACVIHLQPDISASIPPHIKKDFYKAAPFIKAFAKGGKLKGGQLGTFINTIICSELRGTLSRMTQEQYIVRATVQFENLKKSFPLIHNGDKKRWFIETKDAEGNSISFPIRSSKYQTQFLEKSVNPKGGITMKPGDHSLIAERKLAVEWEKTEDGFKPSLKMFSDERVFVSIPFEISGGEETKPKRLLGIDTGEYGLGYTVLETKPKLKIVKQGFISHPSLGKIRETIRHGKTRQRTGMFRESSTKLADIRENAIGALRNRIHDIAVRYKAATIYEEQTSAFEPYNSSKKVSKVYKSVKRADIRNKRQEIKADKDERKLVWGTAKAPGKEIDAYATSNICSSCGESIYAHITREREKDSFPVTYEKDGFCKIKIGKHDINGISKQSGNTMTGREAINAVKNFSRQPVENLAGKNPVFQNRREAGEFKEKRGNQPVFTCPFCGHISDADIQASLIVGLIAYLQENENEKELWKRRKSRLGKIKQLISKNGNLKTGFSHIVPI
ncbi:MAG: type V CRISPR-associated protein Cas12d [Candidatus Dadabacteria bacterium]|nr:type V CRISPR-associated protein Cas12d [Candidatus Dadabacteria bacterium]